MSSLKKISKLRTTQVLFSAILLIFIIYKFEINLADVFNKIQDFKFIWIVLFFSAVIRPMVAARRWQIFLRYAGIDESLIQLIKISFTSTFLGFFLTFDFGVDAIRMFIIEKRYPEKRGYSGASIIAEKMFGFILFCLLGSVGTLFLPYTENILKVRLIIFCLTALVVLITFMAINNKVYDAVSRYLSKISFLKFFFRYITSLHKALTILPYRKILPRALPFMLFFQLTSVFIVYLIFRAFGVDISFFRHLGLVPVVQIFAMVPLSVAGLGLREGTFIFFYNLLNVESSISFGVSIMNFLTVACVSAFAGGLIVLTGRLIFRESLLKRANKI